MNLLWSITDYKNAQMHPIYLSHVSAWHGHIPFAFFITELLQPKIFVELGVHAGDSYIAFCQGLGEAKFERAYGIDTWEGDEHSGAYSPKIYEDLKKINDEHFPFSALVKERFEKAVSFFEDGSINLLHLDGCHTYEAVSRDIEMWRPKMADDGVMLLHDTIVPEFGVRKVWGELKRTAMTYDFYHSNGLGVALVGDKYNETLAELCLLNAHSEGQWVRGYFELLAERVNGIRTGRESN